MCSVNCTGMIVRTKSNKTHSNLILSFASDFKIDLTHLSNLMSLLKFSSSDYLEVSTVACTVLHLQIILAFKSHFRNSILNTE